LSSLVVLDASAGVEIVLRTDLGEALLAQLEARDAVVIAPSHFLVETTSALRRLERTGELERDRALFAVRRLAQLVTPAALDDLIVDAWGLRHNLTVADALYIVLTRRTGAALMSTDERMLGAPGLDDIELVRH
jgi:predicted nucleic acid-binding protein